VDVLDQGKVAMQNLEIGSRILTASGDYKTVYAFGHKSNATTEFLRFFTDGYLDPLEVTARHLVYINNTKGFRAVPADSVKEGDFLRSNEGRATRVIDIRHVKRAGMYAPFTTDGTLVVEGIVASSYISLEALQYHKFFADRMHGVSHLAISPIRFLCTKISSSLCEFTNDEGIPYMFSYLEGYLNFIDNLWAPLHIMGILVYLTFALLSTVVEWLTSWDGIVLSVSIAGTLLLQRWEERTKAPPSE
jgi:hypothetical protein